MFLDYTFNSIMQSLYVCEETCDCEASTFCKKGKCQRMLTLFLFISFFWRPFFYASSNFHFSLANKIIFLIYLFWWSHIIILIQTCLATFDWSWTCLKHWFRFHLLQTSLVSLSTRYNINITLHSHYSVPHLK
jgi:hypothetical protein